MKLQIKVLKGGTHTSPPVQVPIELWRRLCDALSCCPDAPVADVVRYAEILRKANAACVRKP